MQAATEHRALASDQPHLSVLLQLKTGRSGGAGNRMKLPGGEEAFDCSGKQ